MSEFDRVLPMRTGPCCLFILTISVFPVTSCGGGAEENATPTVPTAGAERVITVTPRGTVAPIATHEPTPTPETTSTPAPGPIIVPERTSTPLPTATPRATSTFSFSLTESVEVTVERATTPAPAPTLTPAAAVPAARLASHVFVPVGGSRSIKGLGELLESIHFTEPPSVGISGTTVTAEAGGITCLRFRYRAGDDDNTIQTLCAVSFDETGSCSGLPKLALDIGQFLRSEQGPVGNSNLLESGDGLFYVACKSPTGAYRLQRPDRRLPPLYFTIVDALGDGQYSLGDFEMSPQRAGVVTTFSGAELRPSWIVSVSREIQWLRLTDDLRIEFNDEDCGISPSCTLSADVVRPGDILRIGAGVDSSLSDDIYESSAPELVDGFFRDRIGIGLDDFSAVHPDTGKRAFARLVALDVMGRLIEYFDDLYQLREKEVVVGYGLRHQPLPFPYACFPDEIVPGETELCQRLEEAVQAAEALRIAELKEAGYDLWLVDSIDYRGENEPVPFADGRPHFSLFNGTVAGIGANSSVQVADIGETLAVAVRQCRPSAIMGHVRGVENPRV